MGTIVCVVCDDFVDLLSIKGFFGLNLLIQSVGLLFQFLNGDLLETDVTLEFLVSVEKILVSLKEFFLLDPELRELIFKTGNFLSIIGLGFLNFIE